MNIGALIIGIGFFICSYPLSDSSRNTVDLPESCFLYKEADRI